MLNKIILIFILGQSVAVGSLFIVVKNIDNQSKLLPEKIDMLIGASQDKPVINLDCPECPSCPKCPESKDYSEEIKSIKKVIRGNNNQPGVYYYYSGCQ